MPDEQQTRKPAPPVPTDMKAFNQKVVDDFRANKGELTGPLAGRKLMLLTTTGARSGQQNTVVLGFGKVDEGNYVVVASGNGMKNHPLWYRNLVAKPTVTVEVGPEKFSARARTANAEEKGRYSRLVPYIESEQKKTSREIPLVVLEKL